MKQSVNLIINCVKKMPDRCDINRYVDIAFKWCL